MKNAQQSNLNIQFEGASVKHLKAQIAERLDLAQQKSTLQDNFKTVAGKKEDNSIASMMMTSMLMGMLFGGFADMIEAHTGHDISGAAHGFGVAAELIVHAEDEKSASLAFRNKVEGYPEGRRIDPLLMLKPRKAFNLVSHNDNEAMENDNELEIDTLADMLMAIEALEAKGVEELKMDRGQSVRAALGFAYAA